LSCDSSDAPRTTKTVGLAPTTGRFPGKPGTLAVNVQIDVADLSLDNQAGRWTGSLDFGIRWTDSKTLVRKFHRFAINASDDQLRALLAGGFIRQELIEPGPVGEIQVAVQDRATGAAGSLRLPLAGK
jgi:hypothetical protein